MARSQIAEVLIRSLTSDKALRKTFELISARGPAPTDFDGLFAQLEADSPDAIDAVHDMANMPLEAEPQRVRGELEAVRA